MNKGYFYLGALSIAMLGWGGQGIYTAARNPEPATYNVSSYLAEQPNKQWLNLEDAQLDLSQAAYFKTRVVNTIDEIYVPVFSAEDEERNTVRILLSSDDPDMIATIEALETASEGSEEALINYFIENEEDILIKRPVEGTVTFGLRSDTETKVELKDLYGTQLASDVVIIEDGAKPSYVWSILALTGGTALAGLLLKLSVFNGRRTNNPLPA